MLLNFCPLYSVDFVAKLVMSQTAYDIILKGYTRVIPNNPIIESECLKAVVITALTVEEIDVDV